jgi:hypothetical protein
MQDFNSTVISLLNEYPYIQYINVFDLELENKRDPQVIMQFLNDIFNGETKKDKYDNVILLQSDSEKRYFLTELLNDKMFNMFIKKLPGGGQQVEDFLKTISIKISDKKPRSQYY